MAPLRVYLKELGDPEFLTGEHKRQIIERIMDLLLSPKIKPQEIIAIAKFMLKASRTGREVER